MMQTQLSWRVYYYAILGAGFALLAWYSFSRLAQLQPQMRGTDLTGHAVRGAIFGALVGFGCCAYDAIRSGSVRLLLRDGSMGLALGTIAGTASFAGADWVYQGAAVPAQYRRLLAVLCWISLGALVGLAESFTSADKRWSAILGGGLGGMLGGMLYEVTGRSQTAIGTVAEQRQQAIALTAMGGSIAAGASFLATILGDAWLEILNGKLKGEKRSLSRFVDPLIGSKMVGTIGSNPGAAQVYLPGDAEIAGVHATISFRDNAPSLSILNEAQDRKLPTLLNGRPIRNVRLTSGDRITLGKTEMLFQARRVQKAAPK